MYLNLNRKPKHVIVSTEETHANALTLQEEVEVDWMVDWKSQRRHRMVCKISNTCVLNSLNGISTGAKEESERSRGTRSKSYGIETANRNIFNVRNKRRKSGTGLHIRTVDVAVCSSLTNLRWSKNRSLFHRPPLQE